MAVLPFFDEIDPASVDVILVTHFHLDHAAALPYFMEKTNFKGRVYMTHPTKAIYKWLLSDYVKVSNLTAEEMLYDDGDLTRSFERITAIDYHQEIEFEGIKFSAYNAGHVLGAAMFLVEVAGVKLLYTGDYSREEDRHLMAAEKPDAQLDVLVCESTYGVQSQQPRLERERRFTGLVHDIVRRGGRCLIPVFALGRAQELLLILDEYWQAHPELHAIPIYYASALAKKCMAVYQTYVNMMNDKIRRQIAFSNPFIFKHISYLRGIEHFDDSGPCVMMASPGMLQNGLSRELFELWCPNKQNGVIVAGYCVEGTLAKQILAEPKEIVALNGASLPLRMTVEYISFSAHVDFAQNSQFIDDLHPPNLILVHGESTEMNRLKGALQHRFEGSARPVAIFTPRNCETVELAFRGEKKVKIIGSLAGAALKEGAVVDGVLVGKDFEYQLLAPEDLPEYSQLKRLVFKQRQVVASQATASLLEFHFVSLFGRQHVARQERESATGQVGLQVLKEFAVVPHAAGEYVVEWTGSVMNDLMADSIISVIMSADYARFSVKETKSATLHQHDAGNGPSASLYLDVLKQYLIEHFGTVQEDSDEGKYRFELELKDCERIVPVAVSMEDFAVECDDARGHELVSAVVSRITSLLDVDYIV